MSENLLSIAGQIALLAKETGAPTDFVNRVRGIFIRKLIPLESEAYPYCVALTETFNKEKKIRLQAEMRQLLLSQLPSLGDCEDRTPESGVYQSQQMVPQPKGEQ